MARPAKLIYGGSEFRLKAGSGADVLESLTDMEGGVGVVQTWLENGLWLSFAVGPGIPVAVIEER